MRVSLKSLIFYEKCHKEEPMGRGRKTKVQKMKNRKRQSAKKARVKKQGESVHKSRMA